MSRDDRRSLLLEENISSNLNKSTFVYLRPKYFWTGCESFPPKLIITQIYTHTHTQEQMSRMANCRSGNVSVEFNRQNLWLHIFGSFIQSKCAGKKKFPTLITPNLTWTTTVTDHGGDDVTNMTGTRDTTTRVLTTTAGNLFRSNCCFHFGLSSRSMCCAQQTHPLKWYTVKACLPNLLHYTVSVWNTEPAGSIIYDCCEIRDILCFNSFNHIFYIKLCCSCRSLCHLHLSQWLWSARWMTNFYQNTLRKKKCNACCCCLLCPAAALQPVIKHWKVWVPAQ